VNRAIVLDAMKRKLHEEMLPDLMDVVKLVLSLADRFPKFDRPTEYMAVASDTEYGLYDGYVQTVTPDGKKEKYDVQNYRKITNEYMVPTSTAKYTKNRAPSYMAGALARFNNNFEMLHPEAKKIAGALGLKPLCFNPYLNTAAQVVEVALSSFPSLPAAEKNSTPKSVTSFTACALTLSWNTRSS